MDQAFHRPRRAPTQIPAEVTYVDHPSFALASTEAELFGDSASRIRQSCWLGFSDIPDQAAPMVRLPNQRLSGADEATLFLRYNYARFRLRPLLEAERRRSGAARRRWIVIWRQRAADARTHLVCANLALVLAMAKRTVILGVDFGELVSEGNLAVLRCIEKFDVSRGFKFSTYACRAILKSFHRLGAQTARYRRCFPVEFDPDCERDDYETRAHDAQRQSSVDTLHEILVTNRAELTELEMEVLMERFSLFSHAGRKTLAEVGKSVSLTNERVRQIQNVALVKLRAAMNAESLVA